MGNQSDAPDTGRTDAEAFLKDEELIRFFARQRGLTIEQARDRLKEFLEAVDTPKPG
jgi:hypothetical protein